jgi:hypothetical protein
MRPDIASAAERRLYRELQSQLSDEWVVLHSVWWQLRDTRTGARDGETDFVLLNPSLGGLLLEVKGGRIQYEGTRDEWTSNGILIKDPFRQVRDAKYGLMRKLQEIPFWRNRWFSLGHAVAFPDAEVKADLRLDAPREIILDAADLSHLTEWLDRALSYMRGSEQNMEPLGDVVVGALVSLLSPKWDLRPLLATEIAEEERQLLRLTAEQFVMLDFLGRNRRVAVSGCAGSGKTTLAVEKARRLTSQGFRVLLTCFNVNLADFLRGGEPSPRQTDIVSFHKLAWDLCREAHIALPNSHGPDYFSSALPERMMEAVDRLGPRYDAVIVDEGQDFHGNWWVPLQCLLRDPESGILYVFYDDNQKLYGASPGIPLELAPFALTRNCRNTQHIHGIVTHFYRSDQISTAQGPAGRPVEVLTYDDPAGLKRTLRSVVHRLLVQEGVAAEDIVLLTPKGRERSILWQTGRVGNLRLTDQWTQASGELFCSTVHAFKGLESPVVILAELDADQAADYEALLYVACSRARNHLIVLASDSLPQAILLRLFAVQ